MTQTPRDGHNLPTEDSTPPQGDLKAQGSNPTSTEGLKDALFNFSWDTHLVKVENHAGKITDEQAIEKYTELYKKVCSDIDRYASSVAKAAKIEELRYWQWKTDGHIELSGKEVNDRIAALNKGEYHE